MLTIGEQVASAATCKTGNHMLEYDILCSHPCTHTHIQLLLLLLPQPNALLALYVPVTCCAVGNRYKASSTIYDVYSNIVPLQFAVHALNMIKYTHGHGAENKLKFLENHGKCVWLWIPLQPYAISFSLGRVSTDHPLRNRIRYICGSETWRIGSTQTLLHYYMYNPSRFIFIGIGDGFVGNSFSIARHSLLLLLQSQNFYVQNKRMMEVGGMFGIKRRIRSEQVTKTGFGLQVSFLYNLIFETITWLDVHYY